MGTLEDLAGQTFGKWTVLKRGVSRKNYKTTWLCRCECGVEKEVNSSSLTRGHSKSCRVCSNKGMSVKMSGKAFDLTDQKFGMLTVISRAADAVSGGRIRPHWLVKCDCGNQKILTSNQLLIGKTKSCGCMSAEWSSTKNRKNEPHLTTAKQIFNNNHSGKHNGKGSYCDGNLTFEEWVELSQQPCFYCKALPNNKQNVFKNRDKYARKNGRAVSQFSLDNGTFVYNGIDRIDSSKPHDKDNVVTCCKRCNYAKSTMTSEEFKNYLKQVTSNHLYSLTPDELDEAVKMYKAQKETDSSYLESVSELALVS
jgi:hypothetical protein